MATPRQIEANRRNARRSTGPRTLSGKSISKMNAVRHGLRAKSVVVPNLEDEAEWQAHLQGTIGALRPVGHLEHVQAERIAGYLWRLRRVAWYERNEVAKNYSQFMPRCVLDLQDMGQVGGRELPDLEAVRHLARYEAQLQRGLKEAMQQLQQLREWRSAEPASDRVGGDGAGSGEGQPSSWLSPYDGSDESAVARDDSFGPLGA
jgi:hypothetical protein